MKRVMTFGLFFLLAAGAVLAQAPAPPNPPRTPEVAAPAYEPQQPRAPMPPGQPMMRRDLGAWWKNSEVVKELQLTEAQIKQIEQTFYDHRLKLIDLKADVERQETRLQPLIEADQLDEAKISAQLDLVLAARMKLEKANTMMMLSIRKVLSVEQWKKLQELQHHREFGPGPGGMMQGPQPRGQMMPKAPRPPEPEQ